MFMANSGHRSGPQQVSRVRNVISVPVAGGAHRAWPDQSKLFAKPTL